jgi:hypothetical protein
MILESTVESHRIVVDFQWSNGTFRLARTNIYIDSIQGEHTHNRLLTSRHQSYNDR